MSEIERAQKAWSRLLFMFARGALDHKWVIGRELDAMIREIRR